ncbi:MAG: divergent PAP2 family protein [Bacillota bacterium]
MDGLLQNRVLWASLVAWALAQVLKFVVVLVMDRRVDLTRLVGAGGMPSSHTAFVSALALATGRVEGFHSPLFAVAFVFASIVMYDATGVRQAVGKQAEVLNKIVDDLYHAAGIREERLRELLGHTPVEVLAGAVLGITVAVFFT